MARHSRNPGANTHTDTAHPSQQWRCTSEGRTQKHTPQHPSQEWQGAAVTRAQAHTPTPCTLPLLARVSGVGVCAWARVSAALRHSWLEGWCVSVLVCVLRLYPAIPGSGVRQRNYRHHDPQKRPCRRRRQHDRPNGKPVNHAAAGIAEHRPRCYRTNTPTANRPHGNRPKLNQPHMQGSK